MSGFVYVWKDRKRNKCYVGSHWGNCDDGYICSSDAMRKAHQRRPDDFKRRIVARVTTNRDDLLDEEQRWLDMIPKEEFGRRYYNINGKVNKYFWWMNEDTRKVVTDKMSQSLKGMKAWNKGLTKDDPRVAQYVSKGGGQFKKNHHTWNKDTIGVMKAWNKGTACIIHYDMVCQYCGSTFQVTTKQNRDRQKCCSRSCANRARKTTIYK